MPSCAAIDPLVTPYVDGTLDSRERATVERHVGLCAPCRSRVDAERAIHDLIAERKPTLQAIAAPDRLRRQCVMAVRSPVVVDHVAAAPRSWMQRTAPFAAAASLLLVVGGAFLYQATARSSRVMAAELAADHVKCLAMNVMLGTRDSAESVQSWMASSFGWQAALPAAPAGDELELVGSRSCLYGEGRIAHIMYRHNGQPASLFMLPRGDRTDERIDILGHHCDIWSVGDRTFVLISRESRSGLNRLAAFVHEQFK